MKFEIYQLKRDQRYNYSFMKWSFAKKQGFSFDDYEKVYAGDREETYETWYFLEKLFSEFNCRHPKDFKGHSLSVSDIVVIGEEDNKQYFYCDSFGWEEITDVIRKEPADEAKLETV